MRKGEDIVNIVTGGVCFFTFGIVTSVQTFLNLEPQEYWQNNSNFLFLNPCNWNIQDSRPKKGLFFFLQ